MKKSLKWVLIIICLILTTLLIYILLPTKNNNLNTDGSNYENNSKGEEMKNIKVIINNKEYNAKMENNKTTEAFINLLPQEFTMQELNGNEKFVYMSNSLPTNEENPKHINAGDIMLYGNNCLVIFYDSFDTNYAYTKMGHIDNLSDIDENNVTVKFIKIN